MTELNDLESSFVNLLVRGVTPQKAADSLEISHDLGMKMASDARIYNTVKQMRVAYAKGYGAPVEIKFTRDDAALMYLEAHAKAANTTEEVKATDSLVKLYGLAAPEKKEVEVKAGRLSDYERLDPEDLIELSGTEIRLDPSEYMSELEEGFMDVDNIKKVPHLPE